MGKTVRDSKKEGIRFGYCKAFELIAFSIVLSGCTTINTPVTDIAPPVIQANLLAPCPDLPLLDNKTYTQGEAVNMISKWIFMYKDCQKKHKALSEYIVNRQ